MKRIAPVFGYTKPYHRTKDPKNSKNYEQKLTDIAKTQIREAIKSISFLNIMYFYFNLSLN